MSRVDLVNLHNFGGTLIPDNLLMSETKTIDWDQNTHPGIHNIKKKSQKIITFSTFICQNFIIQLFARNIYLFSVATNVIFSSNAAVIFFFSFINVMVKAFFCRLLT